MKCELSVSESLEVKHIASKMLVDDIVQSALASQLADSL